MSWLRKIHVGIRKSASLIMCYISDGMIFVARATKTGAASPITGLASLVRLVRPWQDHI